MIRLTGVKKVKDVITASSEDRELIIDAFHDIFEKLPSNS